MIQGNFEARKVAYRQTKEGVVISFVIHPNDAHTELATAALGMRFMIGYAEILDDETTPTATDSMEAPARTKDPVRAERAKDQYANMDAMEQARTRASLLCKDPKFWEYLGVDSEKDAAQLMRTALRIRSRSEIATLDRAYDAFLAMETSYLQSVGRFAEQRA